MNISIKPLELIKKYKTAVVSAGVFTLALASVLAFAGNESEPVPQVSEISVTETVSADIPAAIPSQSELESTNQSGIGIFIDNCFIGTVSDRSAAESVLNAFLSDRAAELLIDSTADISFNNDVELKEGLYESETFLSDAQLGSLLGEVVFNYKGESLPVSLSIRSIVTSSENIVLEYETKTIYTDSLANGKQSVVQKGYNGVGLETAEIISIDGVEMGRNVVSLEVTTPAKDKIVRVGTRSGAYAMASVVKFVKPYDGILTSYYGPRWGRNHNGIDVAGPGCNGAPVVAVGSGVVVRADWYSSFGNCVIIDHGNGIQTLYAHFSKLGVKEGDTVSAGDVVGYIGSTGNTTGAHLHFEVRVDGQLVDPLLFVKY